MLKKRQASMFKEKTSQHVFKKRCVSPTRRRFSNASSLDIFDFKISAMLIEEKI